jgi:hypothetical protein
MYERELHSKARRFEKLRVLLAGVTDAWAVKALAISGLRLAESVS